MIDPNSIRKDMPVIASDGETIGEVDGVEGGTGGDGRIKLKRNTSPDGVHHYVPLSDVARVDEHVHLTRAASDVRNGWLTAGTAAAGAGMAGSASADTLRPGVATDTTTTTTTRTNHGAHDVRVHDDDDKNWLPWILGALALLALLIFGLRSCDDNERAVVPAGDNVVVTEPVDTDVDVDVAGTENVMLPGGASVMLAPATIGYELQRFLASNERAPRTFAFDRLNFDTGRSDVRAVDRPTVEGLGKILAAYPDSRVRIVGYADARGDAAANAELGLNRARAVAAMLTGSGIAANRVATASGGESNPEATNATSPGQFENRRTELIVVSK